MFAALLLATTSTSAFAQQPVGVDGGGVFNPLLGADGHGQHLEPPADVTETDFDLDTAKAQVLGGDGGVYHTKEAALLGADGHGQYQPLAAGKVTSTQLVTEALEGGSGDATTDSDSESTSSPSIVTAASVTCTGDDDDDDDCDDEFWVVTHYNNDTVCFDDGDAEEPTRCISSWSFHMLAVFSHLMFWSVVVLFFCMGWTIHKKNQMNRQLVNRMAIMLEGEGDRVLLVPPSYLDADALNQKGATVV
jgi:hypothetical protein